MLELQNILDEWSKDCEINDMKLDETSRETPKLHSKYLSILSNYKLMLKRAEFKQKELLKDKWLYYNGKLSEEELKEKGWNPDPFNGLKILKGEMDYYYDSDVDIQRSEEKIQYYKTTIDALQDIIDNIKWRHQNIKNIIEWKKFQSGS
jgi:hypothetical protein